MTLPLFSHDPPLQLPFWTSLCQLIYISLCNTPSYHFASWGLVHDVAWLLAEVWLSMLVPSPVSLGISVTYCGQFKVLYLDDTLMAAGNYNHVICVDQSIHQGLHNPICGWMSLLLLSLHQNLISSQYLHM